jgi:5-methylcytosine-specific restriction endonuclease McrA
MEMKLRCAYCGELADCTKEHVVPRALYPSSKGTSRVQTDHGAGLCILQ